MNSNWNLEKIYKGVDDPKLAQDLDRMRKAYQDLHEAVQAAGALPEKEKAETLLQALENARRASELPIVYGELRQAVNTQDQEAKSLIAKALGIAAEGAGDQAAARKLLGTIEHAEELSKESPIIAAYRTFLADCRDNLQHMLSDEAENLVSALDMTGGQAWGDLWSYTTSMVQVDYRGEKLTLPKVRNLAYSKDPKEREDAYQAELACYDKIQDAAAFALNNIKKQVILLSGKRGYESPLDMTLKESKMQKKTLDAMLEAIQEYLPAFRKYMQKKGQLLGDQNGLKWQNMFAPIGKDDKTYTLEEAKETLTSVFRKFTPELSDLMARAFDEEWIDFYPREGKEGGAFCQEVTPLHESRILTNFDGSYDAVDTLAHELGHAFHNLQIQNESPLNVDMSMQVAETASTFNETFLGDYALKQARTREEKLKLLDDDLMRKNQTVVDCISRYYFEASVFEETKDRFLMSKDLCQLMAKAQEKTYGDGLDPDFRHPFMWVCKTHYYSSGISFYNFPYAFGQLFAQGLYTLYLQNPVSFLPKYKEMLRTTGIHTVEECGQVMGVDITRKEFWESSLASMKEEIEEFCAL